MFDLQKDNQQPTAQQQKKQQENIDQSTGESVFAAPSQSGFAPAGSPQGEITSQLKAIQDNSPQARITTQLKEDAQTNIPQSRITAQLKGLNHPVSQLLTASHQSIQKKDEITAKNTTGMPDNFKMAAEKVTGHDFSDVNVQFNSAVPAQFNAAALRQGNDIKIAPGQNSTLGHELAHIPQGNVNATTSVNGMPVNDDPKLEKEADRVGDRITQTAGSMQFSRDRSPSQLKSSSALQMKSNAPLQFKGWQTRLNEIYATLNQMLEGQGTLAKKYIESLPEAEQRTLSNSVSTGKTANTTKATRNKTRANALWKQVEKHIGWIDKVSAPSAALLSSEQMGDKRAESTLMEMLLKKEALGSKFHEVITEEGDWRQGISSRFQESDIQDPISEQDQEIYQENINTFLKNVPPAKIPAGTELFHVTKDASWLGSSLPGQHSRGTYSFFTLANRGSATSHSNLLKGKVKVRLKTDLHAFFVDYSAFREFRYKENPSGSQVKQQVQSRKVDVGGTMVYKLLRSWHPDYIPTSFLSINESEIAIYNNEIPRLMDIIEIEDFMADEPMLVPDDLNSEEQYEPAAAPDWMGPEKATKKGMKRLAASAIRASFPAR